jgi:hypothetical protein
MASPIHQVQVAANAAATVQPIDFVTALLFAPNGSLPGVTLFLRGVPVFQLASGFNQPFELASG